VENLPLTPHPTDHGTSDFRVPGVPNSLSSLPERATQEAESER
jgi:hypothetical protein